MNLAFVTMAILIHAIAVCPRYPSGRFSNACHICAAAANDAVVISADGTDGANATGTGSWLPGEPAPSFAVKGMFTQNRFPILGLKLNATGDLVGSSTVISGDLAGSTSTTNTFATLQSTATSAYVGVRRPALTQREAGLSMSPTVLAPVSQYYNWATKGPIAHVDVTVFDVEMYPSVTAGSP